MAWHAHPHDARGAVIAEAIALPVMFICYVMLTPHMVTHGPVARGVMAIVCGIALVCCLISRLDIVVSLARRRIGSSRVWLPEVDENLRPGRPVVRRATPFSFSRRGSREQGGQNRPLN